MAASVGACYIWCTKCINTYYLNSSQMPDCTEHSILSLFAADAKCFRKTNKIEDWKRLQRDLKSLYE